MPGRKLNAPTCTPNGSKGFGSVSGRQLGGTVATVTVSASGLKGGAPGRDWLRSWLSSGLADEGGRAGGISRGRGATVVTLIGPALLRVARSVFLRASLCAIAPTRANAAATEPHRLSPSSRFALQFARAAIAGIEAGR